MFFSLYRHADDAIFPREARAAKPRENSTRLFTNPTRVHGFSTTTKALAREIPPATQAMLTQKGGYQISNQIHVTRAERGKMH